MLIFLVIIILFIFFFPLKIKLRLSPQLDCFYFYLIVFKQKVLQLPSLPIPIWGKITEKKFWNQRIFKDTGKSTSFLRLVCLKQILIDFLPQIMKKIKLKKFCFHIEMALPGPAQTALGVGVLWGLWGALSTQLALNAANNRIIIKPNFQAQNLFLIDFSCILELTLGHIIIILYSLYRGKK